MPQGGSSTLDRPSTWPRIWLAAPLAGALLVGCSPSMPQQVAERVDLPDCGTGEVYAPPRQGPSDTEDASTAGFECLASAHANQEPAELEFVLLGTEGQRYTAILQTLDNGTVDYFREWDGGWEVQTGCEEFGIDEIGFPWVEQCAQQGTT